MTIAIPDRSAHLPHLAVKPLGSRRKPSQAVDPIPRNGVVEANLGLVHKIARDYAGRGLDHDDLVAEGTIGLIRAAEDFDPGFGARFGTYAAHWIKQGIREALTNRAATIRLPAHMVTLLTKWRRAERSLARELGEAPTADRVAMALGLSDAQRLMVERALRARRCGAAGEREGALAEEVGDGREGPGAAIEAEEERRHLFGRLARLEDRERAVVTLRFGLGGGDPLTLKEVGRRLGMTREWARRIEVRAIRKMQAD